MIAVPARSPLEDLYDRSARGQWRSEDRLDWSQPLDMKPGVLEAWERVVDVVYALEAVGLQVVTRMAEPVAQRVDDPAARSYLSMQLADEARHVAILGRYVDRLGARSRLRQLAHFYARFANPSIYRVEGWFFSTLFSENVASQFMKMVTESDVPDPLGRQMFTELFRDEGRHLRFLHLALPGVARTMSRGARTYVRLSQRALLAFGFGGIRALSATSGPLGMDGKELCRRIAEALESQYRKTGLDQIVPIGQLLPPGLTP